MSITPLLREQGRSKVANNGRGRRTRPPRALWSNIDVRSQSISGVRVTHETVLTFPAAYRAIVILSSALASMPLRVFRHSTKFGREVSLLAPDHPVDRLLRLRPNIEQSPMRWKEYMTASMAIRGNAYSEIVFDQGNNPMMGKALALHSLHPERVQVRRDEVTRELYYSYDGDDRADVPLGFRHVLHFPLFGDDIVGKSPITLFRESIGLGISAERHAASTFGKGLNPSGVLTHPGELDDEAFKALDEQFNRRHAGPDNAGRILVLENGMTWANIGFNLKDSQFMEQREFPIEEVARIWGVPPHLLAHNTDLKYNNVEQLDLDFLKHTLLAYMLRIEEEVNFKLLGGDGEYFCKFNTKALLRGDIKTRYEAHAIGRQWGWLSANDVRELEDMEPLEPEIGDIYLSPVNMIPAEKAGMIGQSQPGEATVSAAISESFPANAEACSPALRAILCDAVGRLLKKEIANVERIVKHTCPATVRVLELNRFYDLLPADVARMIGPALQAIAETKGKSVDIESASSNYVRQSRATVLAVFHHGERDEVERLMSAWRQCRTESVVEQFLSKEIPDAVSQ